jgi:hypothetical protein
LQELRHHYQGAINRQAIEHSGLIPRWKVSEQGIESGHPANLAFIEDVDQDGPA